MISPYYIHTQHARTCISTQILTVRTYILYIGTICYRKKFYTLLYVDRCDDPTGGKLRLEGVDRKNV